MRLPRHLFRKDEMGVEPYLYALFWFFMGLAFIGYLLPVLALIFGW